jgi:hypothetical protein
MFGLPPVGYRFAALLALLLLVVPGRQATLWAEGSSESASAETDSDSPSTAKSDDSSKAGSAAKEAGSGDEAAAKEAGAKTAAEEKAKKPKPKYPPYEEVLKDAKTVEGLIKLHRKDDQLFAEISPNQLDRDFIVLISIARGIGQTPILGGFSWGFGDDWVWQFRRAGERIHLVRRNVRFTADKGSPTAKAVQVAYTDSVLFSLPIATRGPGGEYVVNLTPVFMSDLPQISMALPGFSFSGERSSWVAVEGYPKNIELQVAATYASGGTSEIDSVPDSRGATVNVHYSISELPKTSYRPRLADDRVGYFLTVMKDFSKKDTSEDRFDRYVTRWNLEKSDPQAEVSPPKEPIIFWLDKTIPFQYRKPIRDGILEWNKAFEKAGFYDAIEVRQQPEDATWQPGDIRYNTFQWITAGAGFAMGPSRVNPTTGQILDADIIFDADFLEYWKQQYETFTPEGIALLTGGPIDLEEYHAELNRQPGYVQNMHGLRCGCSLLGGMSHQLALSATVMAARKQSPKELDDLIMQGLKWCTMHEVGHTLGLAHNFKASAYYSLADLNDAAKTAQTGLGMSVMDYMPVNFMPEGETQGEYFSATIGPYDMWAIEYGYKPLEGGSPEAELPALKKIAARSGDPRYVYASDQDARGIDPDPLAMRFDLGGDLVAFAKSQAKLVAESWPRVVDQLTDEGEGYQKSLRAFNALLEWHGEAMFAASRYVGGLYVSTSHKGDENADDPLTVVPAEKQREALSLLETEVFGSQAYNFPPELYSRLAASRWSHWGTQRVDRADYPVHRAIGLWQDRILSKLLSPLTLARLHDSELKVPADNDTLTTAELIGRLTKSIFSETGTIQEGQYTDRDPAISSLRRNLQRSYLRRLSQLALGYTTAPQDCQSVAYAELVGLKERADALLAGDVKLDSYSRAHLQQVSAQIAKVQAASMLTAP